LFRLGIPKLPSYPPPRGNKHSAKDFASTLPRIPIALNLSFLNGSPPRKLFVHPAFFPSQDYLLFSTPPSSGVSFDVSPPFFPVLSPPTSHSFLPSVILEGVPMPSSLSPPSNLSFLTGSMTGILQRGHSTPPRPPLTGFFHLTSLQQVSRCFFILSTYKPPFRPRLVPSDAFLSPFLLRQFLALVQDVHGSLGPPVYFSLSPF